MKVLARAVAAALLGSAVLIGGCGDDDDVPLAPVHTGSIKGTITYAGVEPGTNHLMVYAYKGNLGGKERGSSMDAVTATELNGGVSYSVKGLPDDSYFIIAWWELDFDGGPTAGDALAINHFVKVAKGKATTGVDLLLEAGGPAWHVTVSVDSGPDDVISGFANFGAYYPSGVSGPPVDPMSTLLMASHPGAPPMAMITFDGDQTGIFVVESAEATVGYMASDGKSYNAIDIAAGSGTVTVTTYGAVGELIEGTFDVTGSEFVGDTPTGPPVNLTGSFSVVRAMNGYAFD